MRHLTRLILILLPSLSFACSGGSDKEDGGRASDVKAADAIHAEVPPALADVIAESTGEPEVEVPPPPPPLLPGPGRAGYNAKLEEQVRLYDRQFHVFNAHAMGLNSDIVVPLDKPEDRKLVEDFLQTSDGWDFEAFAGKKQFDTITQWQKVAGLYGGVGIAADACRYGVLRDQDYAQEEVVRAREHLLVALERLHMATEITGVEGVVARGFLRLDMPGNGDQIELVPLFDEGGNPRPEVKNNGAWRADNSGGLYPDWIWEDSCSRDQYIGWVAGSGAAWEVIRNDPSISQEVKDTLRDDARALGHALMVVRESGYDLELPDADGRTTLHGYLNEQCLDSNLYVPGLRNGFHAAMALGAVATWAYVSEDPELKSYLYDTLIDTRELHLMPAEDLGPVNTGVGTNFSNFNMAFQGIWLALRYITESPTASQKLRQGLGQKLYDNGGQRQPAEMKQSLFDFIYAAGMAGARADVFMSMPVDEDAVARGVETLLGFKTPPFWESQVTNCDEAELAAGHCVCLNGLEIDIIGEKGWKGTLVAEQVIPMAIRPPSNYHWRSNPYKPNGGGDGSRMAPGTDLRYSYWLARYIQ